MNRSRRSPIFILPAISFAILTIGLGIFFVACKGPADKNDDGTAILEHPPFATLTDSIRQSKSAPGETAALYLRRGDLLSQNNLHELAADDYRRSWELQPAEITGVHYASALSILGHTDAAIRLLQNCREKFPSNTSFPGMLGDIYVQSGRTKAALQLYDTLLQKDSLDFESWYEKGLLLEKAKDTAGALAALQRAYTLQPMNTYTLELAHLYAENRNSLSLTLCDEVLRKDSTHELIDPLFIKGIYYSNTAQYKKAIVQFDSCTRRDWKFTDAYLEKGIALFREKNYEEALKTFKMTINVSDTYPDGYYWAGRCYEVSGNKDQAILYYQQAVALDKDFTEARDAVRRLKG